MAIYIKTFFHGTREMNTQVSKLMCILTKHLYNVSQLAFCYTTLQNLPADNITASFGRNSR